MKALGALLLAFALSGDHAGKVTWSTNLDIAPGAPRSRPAMLYFTASW